MDESLSGYDDWWDWDSPVAVGVGQACRVQHIAVSYGSGHGCQARQSHQVVCSGVVDKEGHVPGHRSRQLDKGSAVSEDRRLLTLTPGGIKNTYAKLSSILDFFLADSIGPNNLDQGVGRLLNIEFQK
jgi:hypothetical protein